VVPKHLAGLGQCERLRQRPPSADGLGLGLRQQHHAAGQPQQETGLGRRRQHRRRQPQGVELRLLRRGERIRGQPCPQRLQRGLRARRERRARPAATHPAGGGHEGRRTSDQGIEQARTGQAYGPSGCHGRQPQVQRVRPVVVVDRGD